MIHKGFLEQKFGKIRETRKSLFTENIPTSQYTVHLQAAPKPGLKCNLKLRVEDDKVITFCQYKVVSSFRGLHSH